MTFVPFKLNIFNLNFFYFNYKSYFFVILGIVWWKFWMKTFFILKIIQILNVSDPSPSLSEWSCWSDWSLCSLTCGGSGNRFRHQNFDSLSFLLFKLKIAEASVFYFYPRVSMWNNLTYWHNFLQIYHVKYNV